MKKIIALGGSNSNNSINKTLAIYAAKQIENTEILVIDLNDFNIPLYGIDLETADGIPSEAIRLSDLFNQADGFVVSLAEHNGSYTAAFKSVFDWLSRINSQVWNNKPMLLMATSPGGMGGRFVLEAGVQKFSRMGAKELVSFSLPNFYDNFKEGKMIHEDLLKVLKEQVQTFEIFVNQ